MKSSIYRIVNRDTIANLGSKLSYEDEHSMIDDQYIPLRSSSRACSAALRKFPEQQLFAIYTANSSWKKLGYQSQIKAALNNFRPYHQIWNGPGIALHVKPACDFKPSPLTALIK